MRRWDSSRLIARERFYAGLNPHRREELLQEIAATLLQADKIVFTAEEVRPIIERWFARLPDGPVPNWQLSPVSELLEQIESQHGLIIQRARDQYSFAHLTIQEFLTARSIAEGHPDRQLSEVANRRLFDTRWREVLVFCAGSLQDGTQLLQMLVKASSEPITKSADLKSFLSQVEGGAWLSNKSEASPEVERPLAPSEILERAASLNLRHSTQSAGDVGARAILECARLSFLGLHFN